MKTSIKFTILGSICFVVILLSVGISSTFIPPTQILSVIGHKVFGMTLPETVPPSALAIIWDIRLPRVLTGFLIGAALSVSGTVMQSVLQNPLASSFTLGVSSGAALGASLVILTGVSFAGIFALPIVGFLFGLGAVVLAIAIAGRIDNNLQNQTIVLLGMVLSLFLNAILTFVISFHRDRAQQLIAWQMGSLAAKKWLHVGIIGGITLLGILFLLRYLREMDILTFGESQSQAMGVNVKVIKWILLATASLLTGTAVCFAGVIGFVDLIAPHVVRRIFGPVHKLIIPASALFGGAFLVLSDTIARTVLAPVELSVGAVTALIGAPFFAYIFFRSRKKA